MAAHIQSHAPTNSARPVRRPDDLAIQPATADPGPVSTGMYPNLGMVDETAEFGALARRDRRQDVSEVILHQTDSDTAAQTRAAYTNRIEGDPNSDARHTGAHYLIDEDGQTSLTVPTDEVVWHAAKHNNSAVGIETVGRHRNLDNSSDLRGDVSGMDLAPGLRGELLGLTDRQLERRMGDNGNNIYEDITGPQKRANWNLLGALGATHDLDLGADVYSHEHVAAKTLGEGANTEEMVDAMVAWPGKIAALEERAATLQADPSTPLDELQSVGALLANERANADAVSRDGTSQERNALDAEEILGEGGPATDREQRRVDFWDDFHPNMATLNRTIEPLSAESAGN